MKSFEIPIWYVSQCADALLPMENSIDKTNDSSKFMWHSKTQSPSFSLRKQPVFAGWYMVEIKVIADKEYLDASFTLHETNKKITTSNYPVLLISQKTIKRIIYIAQSVDTISFLPAEEKVSLTVQSLKFVKLTRHLALKLMQKKLRTFEPDKDHKRTLHLWRHYSLFYKKQQKSETDFPLWIEKREPDLIKNELHISNKIKFRIILDISGETDKKKWDSLLSSLYQQTYNNWEAIIITHDSQLDDYSTLIKKLNNKCKKVIKFIYRTRHDSLKITDILSGKKDLYYLLLPVNTLLSTHALSVYARNIADNKFSKIIYADDDTIDPKGNRSDPRFKPDWNPDLLLSKNYIGECLVLGNTVLEEAKETEIDYTGAWIYSVLIQQVFREVIAKHIPIITHHQTALNTVDQTQKHALQLQALKQLLSRHSATVEQGKAAGTFRVRWSIQGSPPLVSIIIPTRDGLEILKRAIDSILLLTQYPNYEILIIDNQSKEKSTLTYFKRLQEDDRIRVLQYNKPFNFSGLNNYAATKARGSILALLNNDIEIISPNWLQEMVSHAQRTDIGCVGAMLYYPDNRIQHAGVVVGLGGCAGHSHKFYNRGDRGYTDRLICTQNYSAVTAACLVVEKNIYNEAGGLNEVDLAVAFNDVDFCLKVQALGYKNLWTPWVELYHYESVSRGQDNTRIKRRRLTKEVTYMKNTWGTTRLHDPHYSKFLTRIREDFSLGL